MQRFCFVLTVVFYLIFGVTLYGSIFNFSCFCAPFAHMQHCIRLLKHDFCCGIFDIHLALFIASKFFALASVVFTTI